MWRQSDLQAGAGQRARPARIASPCPQPAWTASTGRAACGEAFVVASLQFAMSSGLDQTAGIEETEQVSCRSPGAETCIGGRARVGPDDREKQACPLREMEECAGGELRMPRNARVDDDAPADCCSETAASASTATTTPIAVTLEFVPDQERRCSAARRSDRRADAKVSRRRRDGWSSSGAGTRSATTTATARPG